MINLDNFRALYLEHAARLISYACRFVDSKSAEDIVHDVFVKLWASKIELFEENSKSYLFTAVRNTCYTHLRKTEVHRDYIDQKKHELKLIELLHYDDAIEKIITQEDVAAIYKVIDTLPKQCKYIFLESYQNEKSHQEIALDLNISIRTVGNQIYKALQIIKKQMISVV